MFAFKASLGRFTLIELSRRGGLALLTKITSSREIRSTESKAKISAAGVTLG